MVTYERPALRSVVVWHRISRRRELLARRAASEQYKPSTLRCCKTGLKLLAGTAGDLCTRVATPPSLLSRLAPSTLGAGRERFRPPARPIR